MVVNIVTITLTAHRVNIIFSIILMLGIKIINKHYTSICILNIYVNYFREKTNLFLSGIRLPSSPSVGSQTSVCDVDKMHTDHINRILPAFRTTFS